MTDNSLTDLLRPRERRALLSQIEGLATGYLDGIEGGSPASHVAFEAALLASRLGALGGRWASDRAHRLLEIGCRALTAGNPLRRTWLGGIFGVSWIARGIAPGGVGMDLAAVADGCLAEDLASEEARPGTVPDWIGRALYAIHRHEESPSSPGPAALATRAVRICAARASGAAVPPRWVGPDGRAYLGHARGAAASLSLLARARHAGLGGGEAIEEAAGWVAGVVAQAASPLKGETGDGIPASVAPDGRLEAAPFSGWCHGGPGVAWGLAQAAVALGDVALLDLARRVACRAAARGTELPAAAAADPTLCCGSAGRALMYGRLWQLTGDATLRGAARAALHHAAGDLPEWLPRNDEGLALPSTLQRGFPGLALAVSEFLGLPGSWAPLFRLDPFPA
ncbi:hypothetical protein L6R50_06170 [Myxococcota bacterium]|nr:hypothetical protein [Myxococcota bacterium]